MYDLDELMETDDDFESEDLDELDEDEFGDDEEFEVEQAKKVIRVVRSAARKAVAAAKAGLPPKTAAKKAIASAIRKHVLKKEMFDDEADDDSVFESDEDVELAMELASIDDAEEMEHFLGTVLGGARALLGSPMAKSALRHVARMGTRLAGRYLGGGRRYVHRRPFRYHRRWPTYRRRMYRHRWPMYRHRRAICVRRYGNWVPVRYLS